MMFCNDRPLSRVGAVVASIFVLSAVAAGCGADDSESGPGDIAAEAQGAVGKTYQVGPGRQYTKLSQVAPLLAPGDVVQVDGNVTYTEDVKFTKAGTAVDKITIQGVRASGKRPVLKGTTTAVDFSANNYVFQGFEVTGGSSKCVFHHADGITIRDTAIHDCPSHGLLGADAGSGSLTLDYVEVYNAGSGDTRHPIYMATDETAYPNAVFRMQHSYVHNGLGGNNVKSRARRNEIYYNWIEGAKYHELELIGPDGQAENLAREDSDVVGNVFRKTAAGYTTRFGGDGTGQTWGRYRVVNNTFLLIQGSSAVFRLYDGIESVEMHNNVFHMVGGGAVTVIKDVAAWAAGSAVAGTNNLVPSGTTTPATWTKTIVNNNPGFTNLASRDVRPAAGSALIDAGNGSIPSFSGHVFPSPLALPAKMPPLGAIEAVNTALARPVVGTIDIGAYEYGNAVAPAPTTTTTTTGTAPPPPPPPCVTASTSARWQNTAFASKTGTFTAVWDVTPSTLAVDAAVALAPTSTTAWTGLATIVRFNPTNTIDVRNGSTYGASASIPYAAGKTYHIRMVVNVTTHTYSVYVTPPGGAEQTLATNYAFRTEQASVASLADMVVSHAGPSGSLQACNFALQ
jgi:hypothetical protein